MFEQLLPLIVVAVFVFVKWLIENAVSSRGGDELDDMPEVPRRSQRRLEPRQPRSIAGSRESDEEKMRRFMEALGLPPESAPPPARKQPEQSQPQRPAMQPQRRPATLQPVPPIVHPPRRSIAKPIETAIPKVEMPKVEPPKLVPVSENAPAMEITSIPQQISIQPEQLLAGEKRKPARRAPAESGAEQPVAAGALREQMGNRAALRRAILLKEILGPPKGLQSSPASTSFSPL